MFITSLVMHALLAGPLNSAVDELIRYPSVHSLAVEQFSDREEKEITVYSTGGNNQLEATVFGFLPYWVNQAWLQYDLISVLAVFSVDMGADGTITNSHGFPAVFESPMNQAHAAGGTVVVTVTNFSGSSIHSILTTGKAAALATITGLVNGTVVDGVCIDFENVQSGDAGNLVAFMEDLRTALPDAHISICTPVVDWSGSFNYSELAECCDALMMMCYAFAGSWSSVAGPNAPLTGWGSSPESSSNMAWALCDYVRYAPEVHNKLVVGLPYYGHQWETNTQYPHSGCSDCATLFYTTLSDRAATYGRIWDMESLTPYYAYESGGWHQGWYDDQVSLEMKYDIVNMAGMQGIGIWALGYDGDRPELWNQLQESFTVTSVNDMMTDNLEDCCTLNGPSSSWHPYTEDGQYHTFFYTGSISSGPDVNWVQWDFHLPDSSSSYFLEAYIPPTGTADVTYHVVHGLGEDSTIVAQDAFPGQWISLGGPYCAAGGLSVVAGDCTGTAGERIVIDAIRFQLETGIESYSSSSAPSDFSISASPSSSFTLLSPEGGILRIHDVSGRLILQRDLSPGVSWTWNENEPTGVYIFSIQNGGAHVSSQVVLIK